MPTPDVIDKVRQLRAELAQARPASPEAERIATQLDAVLAEPAHKPHYDGHGERLQASAAGFEGEHPQLATAMTRVLDALSAAGI